MYDNLTVQSDFAPESFKDIVVEVDSFYHRYLRKAARRRLRGERYFEYELLISRENCWSKRGGTPDRPADLYVFQWILYGRWNGLQRFIYRRLGIRLYADYENHGRANPSQVTMVYKIMVD